jgi:multidrug efflux pump subunit AcrB
MFSSRLTLPTLVPFVAQAPFGGWALLLGAGLGLLVIYLFLGSWRSTGSAGAMLTIPALAATGALWAFGFGLNPTTLLALAIAIGLLLDDGIVVSESIARLTELGRDQRLAARAGMAEVGPVMRGTILATMPVLAAVAASGVGALGRSLALVLAVSLPASLVVATLSIVVVTSRRRAARRHARSASRIGRVDRWMDLLTDRYHDALAWALDHRLVTLALGLASVAIGVVLQSAIEHMVTGDATTLPSVLGGLLVTGLILKHSLHLVAVAERRRSGGVSTRVALIEAGRRRLRAVVMTSCAVAAAMAPLAVAGGVLAPLGRALIVTVTSGTVIALLVVPTVHEVLLEARLAVRGWWTARLLRRHAMLDDAGE